jgi:hypothetical protein
VNLTTFRIVLLAPAIALIAISDSRAQAPSSYELRALPAGATLHRVEATPAEYKGRKAIKVEMPDAAIRAQLGIDVDMPTFVRIPVDFPNGTIEVDILSRLNGKGPSDARAFIGISYRITDPEAHFETIYLRPLNGRKKNPPSPRDKRAVQYFAYPDWKFDRLRKGIRTDTTRAGPTSPTTNGLRCGSISTARACARRSTGRMNSRSPTPRARRWPVASACGLAWGRRGISRTCA